MLTRLTVKGFKNLADVDVRFGPFTCVAGVNDVGKSNLFDAIIFLSALTDRPLTDAALSIRDEGERTGDVRDLFHRVGNEYVSEMSFDAEMIVPSHGLDDLNQEAEAAITFLKYGITLAYAGNDSFRSMGALQIQREVLTHVNLRDARKHLHFKHSRAWRRSAVTGRRDTPFISTENTEAGLTIRLHQDGGGGRPSPRLAAALPRTVLSVTNAAENPTALLARREMQSWRLLQLDPSALRRPDEFRAPTRLSANGAHLPSTLDHLANGSGKNGSGGQSNGDVAQQVYARVANRLSELIHDVRAVSVERDDKRELLTLMATDSQNTVHPARALSDGTLRFLALAILEEESEAQGLIALEEPENGIHPERIPAMLALLQDIAVDADLPIGPDNPLRQVIVNTYSPAIVAQVPDDSLVIATPKPGKDGRGRFTTVDFCGLDSTWRLKDAHCIARLGDLLGYLSPAYTPAKISKASLKHKPRRVIDRQDVQPLLPFVSDSK